MGYDSCFTHDLRHIWNYLDGIWYQDLLNVSGLLFSQESEKLWMGDENIMCGEAKEICLVIPCCPLSIEWDWVKCALPIQFFAVIIRQRDPRNVCNAWKVHPFFSGDIIDVLLWALQQNASECDGSIYEIMFFSFVFYAMSMDSGPGWLPHPGSCPVRGQCGASCLWRLEL